MNKMSKKTMTKYGNGIFGDIINTSKNLYNKVSPYINKV